MIVKFGEKGVNNTYIQENLSNNYAVFTVLMCYQNNGGRGNERGFWKITQNLC